MKKGLLLGAGFSYDFGMPLVDELTDVFLSLFDEGNVRRLARLLSAQSSLRHLDELTIIGYGFRDEHINFRITNALLLNGTLRVAIIDPAFRATRDCIKQIRLRLED
jgi:hypothetical protein